jgi:D-alanyl-D-alanine carboxypeptidase
VAEAPAPRPVETSPVAAPVKVASAAPQAPIAQASTPQAAPARKPLDLNTLRPVVASASGASSTTTPSSVRWQKGQEPLPLNAQAYAALPAPTQIPPSQKAALQARIEARAVEPAQGSTASAETKTASLKTEAPKSEAAEPKKVVNGWVIQLGATDDEDKAKAMLDSARGRFGKVLGKASPFTEKVTVEGSTLYRARFSGFSESNDAANACKQLKKAGVNCFASRG